jgi:dynein heavy chain, axonemal
MAGLETVFFFCLLLCDFTKKKTLKILNFKLPSINARKKGKYTEDPIKNLPQLPEKRAKQAWNDTQNFDQFEIGSKENETGQNSFDLIKEINARDPKKYKIGDMKTKKQVKISAQENSARNSDNIKRNREVFRRSLVDIIMHDESRIKIDTNAASKNNIAEEGEDRENITASEDPKSIEKDILRYYYYIHNGIDTEHIAPLETIRLTNVMSLIPDKLRKSCKDSLLDLSEEVREDYLLSVKKAIVDFVLRDSRDTESDKTTEDKLPEYKLELEIVPKPWHASFERARYDISKNLHSINPCMCQLLLLWYTSFK